MKFLFVESSESNRDSMQPVAVTCTSRGQFHLPSELTSRGNQYEFHSSAVWLKRQFCFQPSQLHSVGRDCFKEEVGLPQDVFVTVEVI